MKIKPSRQYDPVSEFRGCLPRRAPSLRSLAVYGLLQLALIGLVSSAAAQVRTNIYFTPYSTRITVPVLSGCGW
jgi:hypothetical protein